MGWQDQHNELARSAAPNGHYANGHYTNGGHCTNGGNQTGGNTGHEPKTIEEQRLAFNTELGPINVTEAQVRAACQKQREAVAQLQAWQGSFSNGVLPHVHSEERTVVSDESPITQEDASPGAQSYTAFWSKDELDRMRKEIRETSKQKIRDQQRRRADIDAECPLFLSLRMRRMLEFALEQPPADMDVKLHNTFDGVALQDTAARAIAQLIYLNNFPPAYIQYYLNDMLNSGALNKDCHLPAPELYKTLIDRMQHELREDPPACVDWSRYGDGDVRLAPAHLDFQAARHTSYGNSNIRNEEVVLPRRLEDRGPPRSWFGSDDFQDDYQFKSLGNKSLPIAQHKEEIVDMIRNNQITLIQGETGCGKTTQVPQYILEAAVKAKSEQRRPVRIVVTQPRRIAAITVAKRVAEELGEKVGEGVVGYKIRGTTMAGPQCKLLFCTTGVILRRLANEGSKWMFSPQTVTHLLVDEVHERGVETDFMLTFLKEVQTRRHQLRVILMSATMDTECFLKYFSITTQAKQPDGTEESVVVRPPMVVCGAFCHPVSELYLESINERLGKSAYAEAKSPDELRKDPNEINESDGIDYDLIVQAIEEMERSPDGAWTFVNGSLSAKPRDPASGALLIFLPGLGEITQLMTKLQEESTFSSRWWVLPLHANLPPEEQQTCFMTTLPPGCTRKIICSTNVAETSITVPDVTCVIDTCRERRTQVDRYSNTPMLREQWCALDSLKQRRGRAGRVQPGVCFRILPKKYLERLEGVTPPEMQRVPLENVYLQVCASGINDRRAFLAKTPDPPDETAVLFAEVALQDLGALDPDTADGLTPLGRHLAALPCHPRLGKILVLGCLLGVPGPCLSICAAMSVRNPMLTTQDTHKRAVWQSARMELVEKIGTRSDHCVWAYIMEEWRFGETRQRDFCKQLGLSYERMCSSMFERKHLCESLIQVGLLPSNFLEEEWRQEKIPDWSLVRAAVVGGLYPNIIHVERSAPRFQSNSPGDKAKWMRYSVLQRHYSRQDNMSYPKSLNLHPNSLCFGQDQYHCPWLAFYTIQHTTKLYAYDVSEVNPFALMLFGAEPVFHSHSRSLEVGGWARFSCPNGEKILPLIKAARAAVQQVLERKLEDVRHNLSSSKELKVCVQLLRSGGLGYRKPSPPPTKRVSRQREAGEFNEFENETAYMLRKDKEHEEKMNEVWANAKKQAAGQ